MQDPSSHRLADLSDATLVERFQREENQEYLGELFRRYRHLVFGLAYRYFRNRDEADDMVGYIFTLLLEKLPGKDVRSFKQYLYGTVRNECLAKTRQIKKEMERQHEWALVENSQRDFMENVEGLNLSNEPDSEEVVREVVQLLGEEQRMCILQFFFEGKSYKEIADDTGFSLKSVKSYLQNGKRNLKKMLEERLKKPST
ncbi:MAG: sigma-70 family RNA polymerase sigma factor [Saprospiraceae bacterium]|nr:sigma-70 family RNA polymerase sigma factor [Saprospiraceae bacterium]MCB0624136.1 sigma-70 family RNA polymerase sigma factor [Saprospiraceae bacterium]MCB0676529.1 sigma-70 family RNA polymerase sigma factor [Saprospiraceae bacterium]MCB0681841.1 sigma-70 family RNA polymerase sigma factor [Saprospiraceae bacterium]